MGKVVEMSWRKFRMKSVHVCACKPIITYTVKQALPFLSQDLENIVLVFKFSQLTCLIILFLAMLPGRANKYNRGVKQCYVKDKINSYLVFTRMSFLWAPNLICIPTHGVVYNIQPCLLCVQIRGIAWNISIKIK